VKLTDKLLWSYLILAIIVSLVLAMQRISIEQQNRNVALIMDLASIRELSATEGVPEEEVVSRFKAAGITGLAFSELTLEQLKLQGSLTWYTGRDFEKALRSGIEQVPAGLSKAHLPAIDPSKLYIALYDRMSRDQLTRFFTLFCGKDKVMTWPPGSAGAEDVSERSPAFLEVVGEEKNLTTMGIGFSEEMVARYRDCGLQVVLRPENKKTVSQAMINDYCVILRRYAPLYAIIFTGPDNDVLGYPDYLDTTAELIQESGAYLGMIEAPNVKALQKGIQTLGAKCASRALRVQSVSPQFQDKLTCEDLVGKFELGVRERNIRLLYLRPYVRPMKGRGLIDSNVAYIESLKRALESKNFAAGDARSFPDFHPHSGLIILMGSGLFVAFLILLRRMWPLGDMAVALTLLAWVVLLALFHITGHLSLWKKLAALLGGMVFPVFSIHLFLPEMRKALEKKTFAALLGQSSLLLVSVSLFTLLGGLIVAGLLSSTEFLIQVDRFRGIKLIMIIPPLFIAVYYMLREAPRPMKLADILSLPVQIWHIVALCILGSAGAYYIVRTGNTTEAATSSVELTIRTILNKVMLVRPRFKEFLIAHPALMVVTAFLKCRIEYAVPLLLLVVAMGQADIIDTLAHIHTPLLVTLFRILNGLVLGWIVGSAALVVFWKREKSREIQANRE
jgi:hypothetical protein